MMKRGKERKSTPDKIRRGMDPIWHIRWREGSRKGRIQWQIYRNGIRGT